eukprot:TRINITY_DN13012_c0_g1_i2.p1 TRINITY_DN13012_c0_g1~~TRINITY_DN13012_c0_g1_i2.p1  ORF type:complete len:1037 (+),score=385.16 TRINITY_DN13012_c0_g1_i2:1722-4832(+)
MDVYYREAKMKSWYDACRKSEEMLFAKVAKFEQGLAKTQLQLANAKISPSIKPVTDIEESKGLMSHLENFLNEKEPLILSILVTLSDDLGSLREVLESKGANSISEETISSFASKEGSHKELKEMMAEHQKELDGLFRALVKTKIRNAKAIGALLKEIEPLLAQVKSLVGEEGKKELKSSLEKIKADFEFLLNPAAFPAVYAETLKEIVRRTMVNGLLSAEAKRLLAVIEREQAQRQAFVDSFGKALPCDSFSYLKNTETPIAIKINLVEDMKEIRDPELEKMIDISSIKDALLSGKGYTKEKRKGDFNSKKELEELQKELEQQRSEHTSIQASLNSKMSELEFALQMKSSDELILKKNIRGKEARIGEMEKEQEKLYKVVQDVTLNFKEHLARKQSEIEKKDKELHNLLIDLQNYTLRKKNCAFCGELIEFKGNKDDYLAEINQKLNEKNAEIKILGEKVERFAKMLNATTNSLVNTMTNKVNDKSLKLKMAKEEYEKRLMEAEEFLVSEQDKCTLYMKQRTEEVEKEKTTMNAERQRLKEKEATLNTKLQQMESKVSYYEKENKKLTLEHHSSIAVEKTLKAEIDQLKKDARIKKEVIIQKDALVKQLTDQKQALLKDCTEAKLALDAKVKEMEKVSKEAEMKVANVEAKLSEKCRELFEAESKITGKQKEKDSQVEKNAERIKALELKLQIKETELDKLKAIETQLKIKEAEIQTKLKSKDQELAEAKQALELKQKEADNSNKQIASISAELKEKQEAMDKLKAQGTPKKNKENLNESHIDQLKIKDMAELIENLKSSNEKYKIELESAYKIEAKSSETISSLKTKLEKVKGEITEKDKIIETNIRDLSITKSRLESFGKRIAENEKLKNLWEESMRNASTANKFSSGGIHYSMLEKGGKMLFMPHSPGIYVALLLAELSGDEDKGATAGKKSGMGVVKKKMSSYVFLDLQSLPDKLQKILMNFSMLVIGIVKEVVQLKAGEENCYKLEKGQKFYKCTLQRLENIVGFEADEPLLTNYAVSYTHLTLPTICSV